MSASIAKCEGWDGFQNDDRRGRPGRVWARVGLGRLRGSLYRFQLLGPGEGGIGFGGPSERLKSDAFVVPGFRNIGIETDGFIESLYGFIVLALAVECTAFVAPGIGKGGIKLDGLVARLNGRFVLALIIERSAFVAPGIDIASI